MAEKRMFSNKITQSDPFLSMPASSQNLYFHLAMDADDDGFVNRPKAIMRMINANDDDMNILITRKFIIPFNVQNENELVSMVCVIKHWFIHNTIRADRKKDTTYIQQRDMLYLNDNGSYSLKSDEKSLLQPSDNQVSDRGLHRLDKNRLDKNRLDKDKDLLFSFVIQNELNWDLDSSYYKKLKKTYKDVDVDMELNKMQMWLISNPTKRKTASGMKRFINSWISRVSDNQSKQDKNAVVNEMPVYSQEEDFKMSDEEARELRESIERMVKE